LSTSFWTVPPQNIKNLNKHAIIDLIRFTAGGVSRVELSRIMGITRAAVTTIVNQLQADGIVTEVEAHFPSGRKPIVLEINPERSRVVGIDMGATHITLLLTDSAAHVLNELEIPFDVNQGPRLSLAALEKAMTELLEKVGLTLQDIHAVGLGVPGPIVENAGMVLGPPIMPGWDGYPIRDHLQEKWGVPLAIGNDAELGAVGEWAYGAGRGVRNLAYIKVGTGVGSGLLLDGQVYRGTTGCAGEIGHITLNESGPICTCGNRGCLEALAGGWAIASRGRAAAKSKTRTLLSEMGEISTLSALDVIEAARQGDLVAQQIVSEAGGHLGTAIASLVNLFNPSMVVVGGKISQMGDLLLEPIDQTVQRRSLKAASRDVRITAAYLGKRSSGMGAVVEALSILLHQMVEQG